ncbi:hypothetical protein CO229_01420 [Mycoplasmopsis bovirhinis]|nr:hypothetical protein CO229_01420 [Mycoplasmopsis bovirhinis]
MVQFWNKFEFLFWMLFLSFGLVFGIMELFKIRLTLGFVLGSLMSYLFFKLTAVIYTTLFINKRFIYYFLLPLKMLFFAGVLALIIYLIKFINLTHLPQDLKTWTTGRINFFSFCSFLSLSAFAIILQVIISKRKETNGKV